MELAENVSTLNSDHMWHWNVESSDYRGWSRISNADGLFLTSKLVGGTSRVAVEKISKCSGLLIWWICQFAKTVCSFKEIHEIVRIS